MGINKNLNRYMPLLAGIGCFAIVCVLYFLPQFEGRSLVMHDIVQYEGSSQDIREHNANYNEDPQWTGNMFSGMPASLISMKYESQLIKKLNPVLEFMGRPASLIFLAMTAFLLMLIMFGVNPWVGIVPSLAYGLSTYFFIIIGAGHITKMLALAYAPLMVGGVFYTLRRNMWVGASITALASSLEISANHPQITYYFVFVLLALWINEGIRAFRLKVLPRFAKATGLLAVAAILAVGSNFAPLWYINEYSKDSIRGGSELAVGDDSKQQNKGLDLDYATYWSYGVGESLNMFIPYLKGGSSEGNFSEDGAVANALTREGARHLATKLPSYWGGQPVTAGPTYIGAAIIFLFVLSLFILRRTSTLWVVVVSLLALMLSWGHNFMFLTKGFFYYFPGYDKFRTVSMMLVVVEWTIPFLAALALNKIWKGEIPTAKLQKSIFKAAGITGGIALFFALFGSAIFNFSAPYDSYMGLPDHVVSAMREERLSMLRADSWRSLLMVFLAAGVVYLFSRNIVKRGVMIAGLALIVCIDLVGVNMRFLPQSKFVDNGRGSITATEADRYILQDKELGFRVLNSSLDPFNDATTSYFHRSVGGYHGAKMRRYQDVIDRYLSKGDISVYNMLNTKYIIERDPQSARLYVIENDQANGAAWFVEEVEFVGNASEELRMVGLIDNKSMAVADEKFRGFVNSISSYADVSGSYISLTDYKPNHLTYTYSASEPAVAVFSEIYYDKGWKAYVDGVETPHFRADYLLRAMALPAGSHTVEFKFRADNFGVVSAVTLVCSLLVIFGFVAAVVVSILCKKRCKKDAGSQEA